MRGNSYSFGSWLVFHITNLIQTRRDDNKFVNFHWDVSTKPLRATFGKQIRVAYAVIVWLLHPQRVAMVGWIWKLIAWFTSGHVLPGMIYIVFVVPRNISLEFFQGYDIKDYIWLIILLPIWYRDCIGILFSPLTWNSPAWFHKEAVSWDKKNDFGLVKTISFQMRFGCCSSKWNCCLEASFSWKGCCSNTVIPIRV